MDRESLLSHKTFPSEEQIEKDYLQHIVLKSIYEKASESIVFKGGTALQKIYGLNRFSEDLDFTLNSDSMREIDDGLKNIDNYSDVVNNIDDDRTVRGGIVNFLIMVRGPISISSITIDVIKEPTAIEPVASVVKPPYGDPQPYIVHVMEEREIFAEKVRTIITREARKSRDLYDLYFMMNNGIDIDIGLIAAKLKYVGSKFSLKVFKRNIRGMEDEWNGLNRFVTSLPEYDVVSDYVLGKFNSMIWV